MPDLVSFSLNEGIATLTMDDGKANAFSLPMSQALDAALDRAAREARVVVIRGRPGVLSGGFDLKVIRGGDAAQSAAMEHAGMRLLSRLHALPQPLVIACTGHAVAGGAMMLLTGDVRIGVRGAFRIGLNEVAIGLALGHTGVELARARLLPTAFTAAAALARLYGPDEAAHIGYLDFAVESEAFDATVAEKARELLPIDLKAFATTKLRLRQPTLDRMD